MFIPPQHLKKQVHPASNDDGSKIRLKASHLLVDHEIASEAFGEEHNIYVIYYPDRRSLLIAPVSDEIFKKLHKAAQQMVKDRNLKGDKSVALHEILIDNQIDQSDRDLEYEWQPALGILNVKL
ncbi:MAG: hypothetical protein AAF990_05050 [Bacteroidota bacterium]